MSKGSTQDIATLRGNQTTSLKGCESSLKRDLITFAIHHNIDQRACTHHCESMTSRIDGNVDLRK